MAENILLADDDAAFRTWASKQLTQAGYEVREVSDGEEAVQAAAGSSLILLDLVLPKLLGSEVCMALRQQAKTQDIPVVFLVSGEAQLREVAAIEDEQERGEDVLRKPVSPDTLLRVVRKWSGRKRPTKPAPGAERRKVPRVPTDLETQIAEVLSGDTELASVGPLPPSRVISISEGGAFVLTEQPLAEGTTMDLVLSVPGVEEAIRARARVVYQRKGAEPGVGVVFTDLSDKDRSRIRLYVELLRRIVRQ